jgi:hypothetical protein
MTKTRFVIYERTKRNTPTFNAMLDVGDKIYRLEAKLIVKQGRSSLTGTLSAVKSLKVWEGTQMLHVLPPGSPMGEEAAEISNIEP